MNNENIYIATCRALFFLIKHIFVNKKLYFYDFYEMYLFGQENIYSFILFINYVFKNEYLYDFYEVYLYGWEKKDPCRAISFSWNVFC